MPVTSDLLSGPIPATADVVVVGGGVNGVSTAFQLAKRGAGRVVLLERAQLASGATGKSGALVRAHYTNVPETTLTKHSLDIFHSWGDAVGYGDPGFQTTGFLRVVRPEDAAKLAANVASHQAIGVDTRVLTAVEAKAIEPLLDTDDITHVAWEPNSGYADPNATVYGFVEGAIAHGAVVRTHTPATRIVTAGGRIVAVETPAGRIATNTVVLVAGGWANQLLDPLGVDLHQEPHRVKVVLFRWPIGMEQRRHPVIIDSTQHSWLRPAAGNSTLIGIEHDPIEIDPDSYEEVVEHDYIARCRRALAARLPIFADATMLGSWAGIIMQSSDGHPIIDRIDSVPGLFVMAGDSGSSFKTAPAIGICLAEWVLDGAPKLVDLTPFRASRFAEGRPWRDELAYNASAGITVSR